MHVNETLRNVVIVPGLSWDREHVFSFKFDKVHFQLVAELDRYEVRGRSAISLHVMDVMESSRPPVTRVLHDKQPPPRSGPT